MTIQESGKLTKFQRDIKTWFLAGGSVTVLIVIGFYFTTIQTLEAHEKRLDKHEKKTEKVDVIENDITHLKETNDRILHVLLEIQKEQNSQSE